MKRLIFSVAVTLAILFWALPASSMVVKSDFGYEITLPSNWTVVSRNDVKDKPDIVKGTFEAAEKDKTLLDYPQDLYTMLKEKIVGGQVEYFYKKDSPNMSISVYEERGTLAQSKSDIKAACELLPQELSKMANKPVKVGECRASKVGNSKGLYVVADSFQGGKYVQYMVQKAPDRVLLFTATGKDRDFAATKSEFDSVMKSLRLM